MENCEISSGLLQGEQAQMSSECSMSFGALVQQSSAILKNECEVLEDKNEDKMREVEERKKLCSRQSGNIAKQQSESERLKVKTHCEEMHNKSYLDKIHNLREKLQILEKYFEQWATTINLMLGYKNELEEITNQLKVSHEMKKASLECLDNENQYYIEEADKAFSELKEQKDREKTELCDLKTHLSIQLEQQKLQFVELQQNKREIQSICREKGIRIDILEPQRNELKKNFQKMGSELALEKEQINLTNNQLEVVLKEELNKINQLSAEIESSEININKTNEGLIDKEDEIQMFNCRLKQLNVEEEEYDKESNTGKQELQSLESMVEELTVRLSTLMKVDDENVTLEVNYNDLQNECSYYKKKIEDLESDVEDYGQKIEQMCKSIDEIEIEKKNSIHDLFIVEDTIQTLKKEQCDHENEHKELSMKIDNITTELLAENDQLTKSLKNISEQVLESSETKGQFEKTLQNLEKELDHSKAVSQQSDFKLTSHREQYNAVNKDYIEEIKNLSESLEKLIQDYEKAIYDSKLNEDTKEEVKKLTVDLENKRENYLQTFQQLRESFSEEIENKSKVMSESRAQCEREFRNKEVMKTDALVELKETKARINDLHKQKMLIEKEIMTKADILKKCDNLIQKLMSKFNKVAQVAITSSQSVADSASQHANFPTPRPQIRQVQVKSPGSDSSGRTFDPDDVDLKRMVKKRILPQPLPIFTNPQHLPKKKPPPAPPKKKTVNDQIDDWDFFV